MQSGHSKQAWTGILRFTPVLLITICLFAVILLSISAAFGKQLSHAPIDPSKLENQSNYTYAHRWSDAFFVFYSGTMPVLTIIHSIIDTIMFFTLGLSPVYALTSSLIFATAWATQLGFWSKCDLAGAWYEASERTCYQKNLQRTPAGSSIVGLSDALGNAKVAFAILVMVLYVIYIVLAAIAVHKRKVQRRSTRIGMKVLDSPEPGFGHT